MKYSSENEKQIIADIKKGNEIAYKALYTHMYERLCVYTLNFTKDKIIAEDIVQETFISLWVNRRKLKIDYSITGYLYRMAYNHFADTYRKNKKIHEELEVFRLASLSELLENNEELFEQRLKSIMIAIDQLPPRCKISLPLL